ncbi:hypothetical protein C7974DRAFT_396605 [Boeremia exigua]|uniref:uncharacterized protein n=1 Tax=Boeremia exigua TaxID=749465 RepID=UPI001E8E815B|nr:uncharacterized protein C7974DRAFT_396605 [Boeremia exigua]KAH6625727.1 hypothetical protein C7974DRAFT_396605 [Boeremia exigua]
MASQYTRLPVQPAGEGQTNDRYELGRFQQQVPERYERFTPQPPAPYVSPYLAQDNSYTSYQGNIPESNSPVSSITNPGSKATKTAVASVNSLTSQHDQSLTHPESAKPNPALRATLLSWGFELFAVTVSLGALLAIILVLRREDGKRLTEWRLAITLNTVIAALGTLARTTLAFALSACVGQQKWNWLRMRSDQLVAWERFDEASRGPWGATRLFIWLRARHWAALGALVIIGTVAFDPFLQAVISIQGQLDDDIAVAHVPQALVIDAGTIVEISTVAQSRWTTSAGTLTLNGDSSAQPDFGIISAVYNGFRNDSSWYRDEQVVSSVCTTGNCTWAPYTSAAMCSTCNDLSDQVSVSRGAGNKSSTVPGPTNVMFTGNVTNFLLPYANLVNANTQEYESPEGGKRSGQEATLLTANTTLDALATTSFQDLQTMIVSFVIMRAAEEWMQGEVAWNNSKPIATECALYLCVNKYQTEIRDGKLKETVLSSWAVRDKESYKASLNSSIFETGPEVDAFLAEKGDILYDRNIVRTDLRLLVPEGESEGIEPRTFNVSYAFIRTISEFMKTFTAGAKDTGQMMAFPSWDGRMGPLVNALWASQNLTETFDHVARSLTNQVRKTATNASHINQVEGTTQKWETHVRVRWAYLAFPAAMIALGIVYVLLTIVESTRLHLPAWKESALPSLLHGLDSETQSLLRNAQSQAAGMKANETVVRFGYDEKSDCLRLVAERDIVR